MAEGVTGDSWDGDALWDRDSAHNNLRSHLRDGIGHSPGRALNL